MPDICLREEPPVNYISLSIARLVVQYAMSERCQAETWGCHKGSSTFHTEAYVLVELYTVYVSIPSNYFVLTSASTQYMQFDTPAAESGGGVLSDIYIIATASSCMSEIIAV